RKGHKANYDPSKRRQKYLEMTRRRAAAKVSARAANPLTPATFTDPSDIRDWHASGLAAIHSLPDWIKAGRPQALQEPRTATIIPESRNPAQTSSQTRSEAPKIVSASKQR